MRCDNEKRRASRRRVLKGAFIAYNDRRCTLPCAVRDIFDKVKCPGRREKNGWRREFFNRRRSLGMLTTNLQLAAARRRIPRYLEGECVL